MSEHNAALVGASFRPAEIKDVIRNLAIGDTLYLEREPTNPHDENAIRINDADGEFLGFIERDAAVDIAPLLDAGFDYSCTVISFLSELKPHLEIVFDDEDYEE